MHFPSVVAALSAAGVASASRFSLRPSPWRRNADPNSYHDLPRAVQASNQPLWPRTVETVQHDQRAVPSRRADNPFLNKALTVNPEYAEKLESVYDFFVEEGDTANADKVRKVQDIGTFYWISDIASLSTIDDAVNNARRAKNSTGEDQIVGLVLYNLPDRDCSGGESSGELESENGGLARYKSEYVDAYAAKLSAAPDVTFAVIVEPDALGNVVTNQNIDFCAQATPVYEEGIAYAISSLQQSNVNLYIDASHGGWLGWDDNLPLAAKEFAKVVDIARSSSGNSTKVRGFSTNVSNYNPFHAAVREPFTEGSKSYDEGHYASSLAPHLQAEGLPAHFIIDQGRVAEPGSREEWGDWCNIFPAGYGMPPGTTVNNTYVDSIVWVKPGGESDGECGYEGAPPAGQWFPEYAAMLVERANTFVSAL